jgi:hypothetical protein
VSRDEGGFARLSRRGCLNGSAFWAPEWRSLADWFGSFKRREAVLWRTAFLSARTKEVSCNAHKSGISGEKSFVDYETRRESPPDFTAMFKVALLGRLSL